MTVKEVIECLELFPSDFECVITKGSYPDTEFVKISRFEVANIIIGSDVDVPKTTSVIFNG